MNRMRNLKFQMINSAKVTGIDLAPGMLAVLLEQLKSQQGITGREFYHYDTPLTVEHETQALREAGFRAVEMLNHWGATYTLRASK